MSLVLLQDLSPEYANALAEGLHKLMAAAAEAKLYKDVNILSSALSTLHSHDNVTEICYRNGEGSITEELETKEPPIGLESFITITIYHYFRDLEDSVEVSSYKLLEHVKSSLQESSPSALAYKGDYVRDYWKVCSERAIEKLLAKGLIVKKSRYKYIKGTCWKQ